MSEKQALRVKFCELIDEVQKQPEIEQRHLFWWFAKEALYFLGVLNGDISEGKTFPTMGHGENCAELRGTDHCDCGYLLNE